MIEKVNHLELCKGNFRVGFVSKWKCSLQIHHNRFAVENYVVDGIILTGRRYCET